MPEFEVFTGRLSRSGGGPQVGFQRGGIISVNRAAFEALAEPEAVELLYDRKERVIGLRKAEPSVPHAYLMRAQRNASSFLVTGRSFAQYYGIDTEVARRYPATMLGDVLTIDLKSDGMVATRRQPKRGHA